MSPLAIEVMNEAGVDISQQHPREVRSLFQDTFQFVVALYDDTREKYPLFPFARNSVRWSVPDPELAEGSREAKKDAFRLVRDQLRHQVELLTVEPALAA